MAFNLPPPPPADDPSGPAFRDWFYKLQKAFTTAGSFLFTNLDFTGSNLTSIATRNHNDLQNIQGGAASDYYHLTNADKTDLTDGGATTLHKHDHAAQDNLNSATYYHLTQANHTDLTDAGDTTLHFHAADRALANATGTLAEANGGTGETTYTDGQVLIGNTAGGLTKATLTAGSNVTITNGDGSITIASSSGVVSVKVYEPVVVAGFFSNTGYLASEPLLPEFITVATGDIVVAWGGSYAE